MDNKKYKIGFIGAGKMGNCLGRYISLSNSDRFIISGYYSKSPDSAESAATAIGGMKYDSLEDIASDCEIILLTVPDGMISEVWKSLASIIDQQAIEQNVSVESSSNPSAKKVIAHCSGCMDSKVFNSSNCSFGSIHPLAAIFDKETAYKKLETAYFTIEGDEEFIDIASLLLDELGNNYAEIDASKKSLYHAASVAISNLTVALAYMGIEMYRDCNLPENFAENAWKPLFLENATNICNIGPIAALTGPVERGDSSTISKHLDAINDETRGAYIEMSKMLVKIAQQKNPDRDYSELINLLEK